MTDVLTCRASRAQQQLWFVEQLVPGEPVHNISYECRFAGRLDPATLRAAVVDLVARHESLRTRFVARDNALWQVVQAPAEVPPVELTDLSGADDPEAAYRDLCARVGTRVFDLGRAPLLRMVHAPLGPDSDGLVVVVHHAVADATSAKLVIRDLTIAYEARLAGHPPDWPELPVQYADFTAWQEERAGDPAARADLEYWLGHLVDLSTVDLTYGRPRPARPTQRGRWLDFTIEAGVAATLDEFVRTERATAFMGLLAAYAATLGRVFGSEDVAVTSPVAGRPLPELRDVIGMFVDQVVLRLDLSGGPTFRELVRAARRVVSEAHDHGSVTFDQIVATVSPERVTGMTPLAQAAINLNPPPLPRPAGRMPAATAVSQIDTGTVTHDLLLDLASYPAPYTATVRYRPDVVDDAAAELVCEVFPRLLRAALAEPDRPMWTFDVLPTDELVVAELPAAVAAPLGARGWVLDRWGGSVPPGCRGELWIGGSKEDRRRSGELARQWPDGRLELCGPDRPAVPEPAVGEDLREPETPVEEALLDGWRWLLPKREFGVTDDFFDIGGDSILAIHAVAEARRCGLELTVRQILELRTIRALAQVLDIRDPAQQAAPLGIAGPTVIRLPGPVTEACGEPVMVDGDRLTADPAHVDDWTLGRIVRDLCPPGTVEDGAPGEPVPPETMRALAGPAHEAYASTTTDLVVAATLVATGRSAVAVADTRREEPTGGHAVPGVVRVDPVADVAELVRAVKTALHAPEGDDPAVPGVRVIPLPDNAVVTELGGAAARVVVTLAGARLIVTGDGADGLAGQVRDHLVRIVEHCVAAEPAYSAADFPDAGLDDAALAGLLAGLEQDLDSGLGSEAAP